MDIFAKESNEIEIRASKGPNKTHFTLDLVLLVVVAVAVRAMMQSSGQAMMMQQHALHQVTQSIDDPLKDEVNLKCGLGDVFSATLGGRAPHFSSVILVTLSTPSRPQYSSSISGPAATTELAHDGAAADAQRDATADGSARYGASGTGHGASRTDHGASGGAGHGASETGTDATAAWVSTST